MKPRPLLFLCASLLIFSASRLAAATWTGSSSIPTNLWSDINNWDSLALPASQVAAFGNAGSTNLPGVENNVVDTSLTITSFDYKAQLSAVGSITNYHTTKINPGVTLTIDNGVTNGSIINVGDTDPSAQDNQYFATIIGTNASLLAGNVASPNAAQGMQSVATSATLSGHIGVLDMSGLDSFTFAGGYVWVGASAANAAGATDRPNGKLFLARTNLIIAVSSSTDGAIRVGESKGNTPPRESQLELGQENVIQTTYLKIGGIKDGPSAGGRLSFRAAFTNNNPTLKLRGADGVGPVPTFAVGDNFSAAGSSIGTRGTVDLSNGTIDVLVDTAQVGRSTSSTSGTGAATGTITWTAGMFDVTTLNIGYQGANATANATGIMNVRGGTLLAGNTTLGRDAGSNTGRGIGTLNISGGAKAIVSGTIAENNASGGNGSSSINITNGVLSVGGAVTVDNINLNAGSITNAALITVTALKGTGAISGTVTVVSNLTPGLPIGTLTISNDVVLSTDCNTVLELNLDTLAADQLSGVSNLTFGGTLTLTNIAGATAATNGMVFKLFGAATYSGSFVATNLPSLGSGFTWDLNNLGSDGTAKLVSNVNSAATNLVVQVSGNVMEFSWPLDHLGWRLQAQTNTLGVGLNANWVTISGTDNTNRISVTINPTNETVFYRMIYP